jgi:(p)ppGpp synthase/HD superfamily hydrolase
MAFMTFTVETHDAALLPRVLNNLKAVKGVRNARRR